MAEKKDNTYTEIEIKEDCKFYHDMGKGKCKCSALNDMYCKHEKCKFYKRGKVVIG